MRRRQLLRVAGTVPALALANTASARRTSIQEDGDCSIPECIHPRLGYAGFSTDDVGSLADGLQPEHEVQLSTEPRGDSDELSEGDVPEAYFDPTGLAVESGDVVQFTLDASDHTITAYHPDLGRQRRVPENAAAFSSPVLGADSFWLYRFDESGVYDLYCSSHERVGMAMRIVVGDADEDFGDAGFPDQRGPEGTATTVLDDDALNPPNVVDEGELPWDNLDDASKQLPDESEGSDAEQESGDGDGGDDGDTLEADGLEITEHELVEDDFSVSVEGVLGNNSGETVDYVEVGATFYDEEGRRVEDNYTNTTDLEDGEEWLFEILTTLDADEFEEYEIGIRDTTF